MINKRENAIKMCNAIKTKKRNKKIKEYKERALKNDLDNIHYNAIEKAMRRKIGQI